MAVDTVYGCFSQEYLELCVLLIVQFTLFHWQVAKFLVHILNKPDYLFPFKVQIKDLRYNFFVSSRYQLNDI